MTEKRSEWTDEEWAAHLGCVVRRIPYIRKIICANFFPGIDQNKENGKFSFCIKQKYFDPSGTERFKLFMKSNKEFESSESAIKHAKQEILPGLKLTAFRAHAMNVPVCALQMLRISERQK
jgi:hypothetical protein